MIKIILSILVFAMILAPNVLAVGDPDMTSIFGRDLKDFNDATVNQTEGVQLKGNYLLLYISGFETGNKKGIFLKNTLLKETIEISGNFVFLRRGAIIPKKGLIILAFEEMLGGSNHIMYLQAYNYIKKRTIGDSVTFTWQSEFNEMGFTSYILTQLLVSQDGNWLGITFKKFCSLKTLEVDHFCYEINQSGLSPTTNKREFSELVTMMRQSKIQIGEEYYNPQGEFLREFYIKPGSDIPWADYKPKYNGIYIYNSKTGINTRISLRLSDAYDFQFPRFWLENGTKLVRGGYLYDVTGNKKELKLVDEQIVSLAEI